MLVVLGVIVVAMLPRGATDEPEQGAEELPASAAEHPILADSANEENADTGKATKRVIEGCDPLAEARKYEELVDKKALAVLRWNNMGERAAKLKIPVYVKSVDEGAIAVSILEIPMREQYLTIWQNSRHIEPASDGTFLLDPCAAWIEAWEAMDRAADEAAE